MIHEQEKWPRDVPSRFYAYCACGVCGPLRHNIEAARLDDEGHASVCLQKQAES